MNHTQTTIVITARNDIQLRTALETLKGFKAVTALKTLSTDAVANVFAHNKNVLHLTTKYNISMLEQYSPLVFTLANESNFSKNCLGINSLMEDFPALLEKYDVDVGDHISHDSKGNVASTQLNRCLLCKIRDGVSERKEHILYNTPNFYVVPGLGAFFEGYLMIVPKRHVMSFAELDPDEFSEFLQTLNDLRFILESIYNKKIFAFECGSGYGGAGKHATSITHAHFHLAPTDMPVFESICKSGLTPALIDLENLNNYGRYPYMLYGTQDDEWYICSDPDSYFPRQHPRQILADYMGLAKGEYNWRTHPYEEKMDIIANEFTSFVKRKYDKLPIWVQEATAHLI